MHTPVELFEEKHVKTPKSVFVDEGSQNFLRRQQLEKD